MTFPTDEQLLHLRGLTLHQPWNWAILHGGKTWENRPVRLPETMRNRWIALHAGKVWDDTARGRFAIGWPPREETPTAAITGLVRFSYGTSPEAAGSPWAFGPWCYRVSDVLVLPQPVPCRGMQGWWPVPAGVIAAIAAQVRQLAAPA
jgi:hypothetical protein